MTSVNEYEGLEELILWQKSMQLSVQVCKYIVTSFPPEEKYALGMQLRRSIQSIPANVAEGYGRFYYQEGIRFCYIARGSLEESLTHLILAHEMKYISNETFSSLNKDLVEIRKMLNGYIGFLKKNKRGINEPGYMIKEEFVAYDAESNEDELPQQPSTDF